MKRRLLMLVGILLACAGSSWATACTNGTFGAYTCVQACGSFVNPGTSTTCPFTSNITPGNTIFMFLASASGTTNQLAVTVGSCAPLGSITSHQNNDATNGSIYQGWAQVNSTGACTLTATGITSQYLTVIAVEISGSSGVNDGNGINNSFTLVTTPNPINAASITTTVNGDLIVSSWYDLGEQFGTWTANSGTIMTTNANTNTVIQGQVQATAGAIQPTMKYSANIDTYSATAAFEAPAAAPEGTILTGPSKISGSSYMH
jgi:hypothetical protein